MSKHHLLTLVFTVALFVCAASAFAQDATPAPDSTPIPLPPEPVPDCPAFADEPQDIRVGYYMGEGIAYLNTSQLTPAKTSFACVVEVINPSYVAGWMGRAEVNFRLREFDRAQADYNTALQYDPNLVAAYNNRGVNFAAQFDYDRAVADFDHAIQLDPDYLVAYSNRAIIHALKGEYDQAASLLDEAVNRSGIEGVLAEYRDPNRLSDAPPIEFDPMAARLFALQGILYEARALENFEAYTDLYNVSGRFADERITNVTGALQSRFTFDLRLDDGSWLVLDDFLPQSR